MVTSLVAASLPAQEKAKPDSGATDQGATAKDGTYKVKQAPFKIEVDLSGIFEADHMWPVALRPESYSSFSVIKAVPPGKRVQKGETLVWLDMKEIDQQIQDLQHTLRLNELSQQSAKAVLDLLKTTVPLDLESAIRAKRIADEDLNYFLQTNRAFEQESAEFSLKSSKQSLEYAQEELKQLEEMYNADDLTEETEEIVLKRARNDVERARFYLKSTELRTQEGAQSGHPPRRTGIDGSDQTRRHSVD